MGGCLGATQEFKKSGVHCPHPPAVAAAAAAAAAYPTVAAGAAAAVGAAAASAVATAHSFLAPSSASLAPAIVQQRSHCRLTLTRHAYLGRRAYCRSSAFLC